MYEIKENRRELFDGTEITTYTRDVVSANILQVEAGTTGYKGGDITEFDEALVKKLIEKITVFADHFTVEFKSGITIDIEA